MTKKLFCFGLGYSAVEIARDRLAAGWTVAGTVRTEEKAQSLRAEGIEAVVYDGSQPEALAALDGATHLLQSVPTSAGGDPVLANALTAIQRQPIAWLGYLSTTVVYGDWQGDWVDEDSETRSDSPRGRARLEAERGWVDSGLPVHIFRLAGIYGPGRNALVSLNRGRAQMIDKPGQVFSRIHREDIKRGVVASMLDPRGRAGAAAIYNMCDDYPCPPQEVTIHAAGMLGVTPPPLVAYEEAAPTMSEMARSFYADNKRVRNDKIKRERGVTLAFPTYREGLADAFARMNHAKA